MTTKATRDVLDLSVRPILSIDVNGGTIDGTPIGVTTPDEGHFTNLFASNLTVTNTANLPGNVGGIGSLSGTGLVARTGTNTFATRTLAVGTGLSITNADGVAGNPNLTLSSALQSLTNINTNGIVVRNGSGSFITRTITAGTGITVTNGDGVSGNPTIALSTSSAGTLVAYAIFQPNSVVISAANVTSANSLGVTLANNVTGFRITFTTPMANTNYRVCGSVIAPSFINAIGYAGTFVITKTTTYVDVGVWACTGPQNSPDGSINPSSWNSVEFNIFA